VHKIERSEKIGHSLPTEMQENVRCETETKLALPLVFISLKNSPLPLHLSQIRRNALEVEWKFRFHAAKEYLDVWTRI